MEQKKMAAAYYLRTQSKFNQTTQARAKYEPMTTGSTQYALDENVKSTQTVNSTTNWGKQHLVFRENARKSPRCGIVAATGVPGKLKQSELKELLLSSIHARSVALSCDLFTSYSSMVVTYDGRLGINRGVVASPARGQLKRKTELFPVSVRA